MRTLTLFKALLTFAVFISITTNMWAQTPPNGTKIPQAEAEQYLQRHWDDKAKLQYFSLDTETNKNVQTVFAKGSSNITHVRMARGVIENTEYIFTIGVNAEGKLVGDYYVSKSPKGQIIGPCPRNCD